MSICKSFRLILCLITHYIFLFSFCRKFMAHGLLQCYDSQSPVPTRLSFCQLDEVCYSEYYAMNMTFTNSTMDHYFDRFCVHERHCNVRGLWPEHRPCLNFGQLDSVVARTFERKLRLERLDPDRLVHSLFCCCSTDKCNEMGTKMLKKIFNVTVDMERQQFGQKGRKMPSSNGKMEGKNLMRAKNEGKWAKMIQIQQLLYIIILQLFNNYI